MFLIRSTMETFFILKDSVLKRMWNVQYNYCLLNDRKE